MRLVVAALAAATLFGAAGAVGQQIAAPVDVAALIGTAAPAVTATVDDPVYRKQKRYAGHALADLLRKAWPDVDRWAADGAELVFRATDGYSPSMSLARALSAGGVVAVRDLDRPEADPWEPFAKGRSTTTPAPYYVVWTGIAMSEPGFTWPYHLASVAVEGFEQRYGRAAPPQGAGPQIRHGFRQFVQNCIPCHSVNLIGGDLAPELNVPRNITEYWSKKHLAAFVKAPETYRLRSKMPGFANMPDADRAAIIAYLGAMRARKICPEGRAC